MIKKEFDWSIGIYVGEYPLKLLPADNITNPIITAKDITDIPAEFVADPFVIKNDAGWHMFFEVMNYYTHAGEIGLAISDNGFNWAYKQIILKEPFHLAYPYTFKYKEEYYMMPDCYQTGSIRLYKAMDFPLKWAYVKTLLNGHDYTDSSIFYLDGKWWLFATSAENYNLYLYYADQPLGPWAEHPKNPVIKEDMHKARSAGRVLNFNGQIIRFTHCDWPIYGSKVYAFSIVKLTTEDYKEEEFSKSAILEGNNFGWNSIGMHHIDTHPLDNGRWIAYVDGCQEVSGFNIRKLKLKLAKLLHKAFCK